MIKEAVKERQANPPKSKQKAFIDVILENSSTYSDATMISEAMSIMVEGFHTSGYREYNYARLSVILFHCCYKIVL